MDLQTCSLCTPCLKQEQQQEHYSQQLLARRPNPDRRVYSFRLEESRRVEDSDKRREGRGKLVGSVQSPHPYLQKGFSPPTTDRFYSPIPRAVPSREGIGLSSLLSPRAIDPPKIKFVFNSPQVAPTKAAGKRIRTIEEETEYSSKHSQVIFRTAFQIPENCPAKGKKHIVFQQPSETSGQASPANSLHTISECILSQQNSHPAQLQHNTTFQSIITSTEIKSRNSNRFQGQLKWLRAEGKAHNALSNLEHYFEETPKPCLSPREQQLQVDPTMFYESCRRKASPRVSVLSFSKHAQQQNDEQEQLRDVIDHNFLVSQGCSKSNSPKVSINPSLKNLESEHSERKHLSPFHSRENSWELGPLMSTRAKMKRTNTIESIESFSSEMISCLDIKFMQKNKGRRGVSRLI